ncbi:hypothetical protein EDC94DRAFT_645220 [Helicostylum pulchrum]|nr:hypothetical protein EDC94DRAFT_645220 [Helicostylum pulchrum]
MSSCFFPSILIQGILAAGTTETPRKTPIFQVVKTTGRYYFQRFKARTRLIPRTFSFLSLFDVCFSSIIGEGCLYLLFEKSLIHNGFILCWYLRKILTYFAQDEIIRRNTRIF